MNFISAEESLRMARAVPAAWVLAVAVSVAACSKAPEAPAVAARASGAAASGADAALLVRAKNVRWSPAPSSLPPGAKSALLQGNPAGPGRYVIRMLLPASYKVPFHSHSNAMDVTVVSGTLFVANTQSFDKKKAFAVKPGDFYHLPAQASQLIFTKGETIVEIHGDGPYDLKYANAADDPFKGGPVPPYSFTAAFGSNDIDAADADDTVDLTY